MWGEDKNSVRRLRFLPTSHEDNSVCEVSHDDFARKVIHDCSECDVSHGGAFSMSSINHGVSCKNRFECEASHGGAFGMQCKVARITQCEASHGGALGSQFKVTHGGALGSQCEVARKGAFGAKRAFGTNMKKVVASVLLSVMLLLFYAVYSINTLCYVVNSSDGLMWANFNNYATDVTLSYTGLNVDKLTSATVSNIKGVAKKRFNNNYNIAIALHFELSSTSSGERLTDFGNLSSIEMLVSIEGGQANTASDAYCAVFVTLGADDEARVLNDGQYGLLDDADATGQAIRVTTTEGDKINLTMDADSDGFLFILALANSDKNNLRTIIMLVSFALTVLLVGLLLYTLRKYQLQRRRKKVARQVKDLSSIDAKSVMSAKVAQNFDKASHDASNNAKPATADKATATADKSVDKLTANTDKLTINVDKLSATVDKSTADKATTADKSTTNVDKLIADKANANVDKSTDINKDTTNTTADATATDNANNTASANDKATASEKANANYVNSASANEKATANEKMSVTDKASANDKASADENVNDGVKASANNKATANENANNNEKANVNENVSVKVKASANKNTANEKVNTSEENTAKNNDNKITTNDINAQNKHADAVIKHTDATATNKKVTQSDGGIKAKTSAPKLVKAQKNDKK